jgi:hypothetical protein
MLDFETIKNQYEYVIKVSKLHHYEKITLTQFKKLLKQIETENKELGIIILVNL